MSSVTPKPPIAVFQLRAEQDLLKQVKELAKKRHVSANRVVVQAVKDSLRIEQEREWREGFEAMGRDPDMNVEYLIPAAQEVIFGD